MMGAGKTSFVTPLVNYRIMTDNDIVISDSAYKFTLNVVPIHLVPTTFDRLKILQYTFGIRIESL